MCVKEFSKRANLVNKKKKTMFVPVLSYIDIKKAKGEAVCTIPVTKQGFYFISSLSGKQGIERTK